jgi:hypothetical protein
VGIEGSSHAQLMRELNDRIQAAFTPDQVQVVGRFSDYARVSDEGDRKEHVFHFCPDCGATVFYTDPAEPDEVVVSVGAIADPSRPPPTESIYESRRHPWLAVPARSNATTDNYLNTLSA